MFLYMVFALLIAVAIIVSPSTTAVLIKAKTYAFGIKFMFVSKDLPSRFNGTNYMHFNAPATPGGKRVIRVVFIRHGQSVWNSLFNSFGLSWPVRIVKSFFLETLYFFTQPFESLIVDSPLSAKGVKEAVELSQFVRSSQGKITNDVKSSVVVCSNLRRAMETAVIGLQPRLTNTKERVVVDSSLQEGSKNIDAQSLSTEVGKIAPLKLNTGGKVASLQTIFDPYLNKGNRTASVDVYGRMDEFIRHVFGADPSMSLVPSAANGTPNGELKEIIVVGHSGYFRNFFRRFLPAKSTHISKTKKMKNCAVVAFNLIRDENTKEIYVDESSVAVLYKGF